MAIFRARFQTDGAEGRAVGGVGEHLRLQRHAVAHAIGLPALAGQAAIEEIARIELHAGLGRQHLQHAARCRVGKAGEEARRARALAGDHPAMVVAVADADLVMGGVAHPRADHPGRAEIEGGACDGGEVAGGDRGLVGGEEVLGRDGQHVVHRPGGSAFAREVPVGVVGHVDERRPVGGRPVGDGERAVIVQHVFGHGLQGAREALIAIGAGVDEPDEGRGPVAGLNDCP